MDTRNKGLGFFGLLILVGCFLVLRPLMENLLHEPPEALRRHVNAAALALAGVLTFGLAAYLDGKSGMDVLSKRAWTSGFFESQHIMLYLPLRFIGVLYFAASFLFSFS